MGQKGVGREEQKDFKDGRDSKDERRGRCDKRLRGKEIDTPAFGSARLDSEMCELCTYNVSMKRQMREHYDFDKMKGRKNPYTKYLKQPVTMRLDRDTVAYFKRMAEETEIPYQTLINLYLRDCASSGRKLKTNWEK